MQDLEFSKMWVGSVIICDKPNFEVRSWSWEPSKLVLSISHHCLDFALKSPIIIVRNGLQLDNESRFSSRFDQNIWDLSCVWLGDLYRWIKLQILLAMLTSKLIHSFRFKIFNTFKRIVPLWKMHTPPLLQLEAWSAQYILYPCISKFGSLGQISEFKNVSYDNIHIF